MRRADSVLLYRWGVETSMKYSSLRHLREDYASIINIRVTFSTVPWMYSLAFIWEIQVDKKLESPSKLKLGSDTPGDLPNAAKSVKIQVCCLVREHNHFLSLNGRVIWGRSCNAFACQVIVTVYVLSFSSLRRQVSPYLTGNGRLCSEIIDKQVWSMRINSAVQAAIDLTAGAAGNA